MTGRPHPITRQALLFLAVGGATREGVGADITPRGLHRVGLARCAGLLLATLATTGALPGRLLHEALVVGLLQGVRDRAVVADFDAAHALLLECALVEGLLQRVWDRAILVDLALPA